MKRISTIFILATLAWVVGCGDEKVPVQPKPEVTPVVTIAPTTVTTKMIPAATKYTCSMHPEVVSDKPGKCPTCGMDLVPAK